MEINYYCFPTKTGDISVFIDLAQYSDWETKQHFRLEGKNALLAKEKGKLVLFNLRNNTFVDVDGRLIDISEKVIFPRTTVQESKYVLSYIEKANAKSIVTNKDNEKIKNWFDFIRPKRKIKETTFGELKKNLLAYEQEYGKYFFIKTVEKGFATLCYITDSSVDENEKTLIDLKFKDLSMGINTPREKVIVSPAVSILKDNFGKRQWRAFVVNDELLCLSRTSREIVSVEEYVYDKVKKYLKNFKGVMPCSYTADFFEYFENSKVEFDICNFNPINISKAYRNNNIVV